MDTSKIDSSQPSYSSEFNQSVRLFEESFHAMQHSKFQEQRQQYVKVMHESLQAMQDSASAMVNHHLLSLKENLSKDLQEYIEKPTEVHRKKVETDIQSLKSK